MEKLFYKISRLFLSLSLMLVFGVVMVAEIGWLNQRKSNNAYNTGYNVGLSREVAVVKNGAVSINTRPTITSEVVEGDARPLIIKRYLEKYESPLVPYSDLIFQLSKDYGFDYYWIVAIAQQESNLCKKIPENSHNCWGYGINSAGTLRFDSYDLALKSYAEYLKREYFDKGLNTAELIMKKYCPHSNGSWAYGVNHFINDLETGNF